MGEGVYRESTILFRNHEIVLQRGERANLYLAARSTSYVSVIPLSVVILEIAKLAVKNSTSGFKHLYYYLWPCIEFSLRGPRRPCSK